MAPKILQALVVLAPVILPPTTGGGPKKKKKPGRGTRPGHARAEVMTVMSQVNDRRESEPAPEPGPALAPTPAPAPTASPSPAPAPIPPPVAPSRPKTAAPAKEAPPGAVAAAPPKSNFNRQPQPQPVRQQHQSRAAGRTEPAKPTPAQSKSIGSKIGGFFGLGSKKKGKPVSPATARKGTPAQSGGRERSGSRSRDRSGSNTRLKEAPRAGQRLAQPVAPVLAAKATAEPVVEPELKPETAAEPEPEPEPEHEPASEPEPETETETETESTQPDGPETVAQKSSRTVAFASEMVGEIGEKFDKLQAQQAALFESATGALQTSVANREALKAKAVQLEEAVASEDYELAAALEGEIEGLKLSLDAEGGSADTASIRDSMLELLDVRQRRPLFGTRFTHISVACPPPHVV